MSGTGAGPATSLAQLDVDKCLDVSCKCNIVVSVLGNFILGCHSEYSLIL